MPVPELMLPVGPERTVPPGVTDEPVFGLSSFRLTTWCCLSEVPLGDVPPLVAAPTPGEPPVLAPAPAPEPVLAPVPALPEPVPVPAPALPEPVPPPAPPDCATAKPPPQASAAAAARARILEVCLMGISCCVMSFPCPPAGCRGEHER